MFPSSFTNGLVIKLPSTLPPPSSTLHSAFLSIPQCVSDHLQEFQDVLQSDEVIAALPHHMIPHHYLTKPGLPGFAKSSRFDLPSLLLPRHSFPPWKRQGLSTSKSRREVGGCVVITTSSIPPWFLIVSLFLKSLHVSEVLLFFLNWIYRRGIIGCQSSKRTSRRPPSSSTTTNLQPSPQSPVFVLVVQCRSPGSEFQQFSYQTEVLNSHLKFGLECALFWGFQPPLQPFFILKVSDLLSCSIKV